MYDATRLIESNRPNLHRESRMKAQQFHAILSHLTRNTERVLGTKAVEYASEKGSLHNFIESAKLALDCGLATTPALECFAFMRKHLISIADICKRESYAHMGLEEFRALLDEKFGDAINYLILVYACIVEQHKPALYASAAHCTADLANHP